MTVCYTAEHYSIRPFQVRYLAFLFLSRFLFLSLLLQFLSYFCLPVWQRTGLRVASIPGRLPQVPRWRVRPEVLILQSQMSELQNIYRISLNHSHVQLLDEIALLSCTKLRIRSETLARASWGTSLALALLCALLSAVPGYFAAAN